MRDRTRSSQRIPIADHQHYGPEGKFGGIDDYGDRLTVSSPNEIVKFVYPPGEFGYAEPDWREFDDL